MRLLGDYRPGRWSWPGTSGPTHRLERDPELQGEPQADAGPAARAAAVLRAARRGVRLPQRRLEGYRGRRRDRHAGHARARRGPRDVRDLAPTATPSSSCPTRSACMMTPRGVTDVRVYTPERGRAQRYGIGPELMPDFIGLKGDTVRQHPGRARHRRQDRGRAAGAVRLASRACYAHLDEVSGDQAPRDADRARDDAAQLEALATIDRAVPLDVDLGEAASRLRPIGSRHEGAVPPLRVPARCWDASTSWRRRSPAARRAPVVTDDVPVARRPALAEPGGRAAEVALGLRREPVRGGRRRAARLAAASTVPAAGRARCAPRPAAC